MDDTYALALHGGAGVRPDRSYARGEALLADLARAGEARLKAGDAALDVVEEAVRAMEESGLFVAGRGAGPNSASYVELDAAIMDGARRRAGAVAAVRDIVSPIGAARRVMEASAHVLIVGAGAGAFARAQGLSFVEDPAHYYLRAEGVSAADLSGARPHGTVGAVARDTSGRLAAATSTGGVFGKLEGRVGDSPLIGAGAWADAHVAVSCTGVGEAFILSNAAAEISARVRLAGASLQEAAEAVLANVAEADGDGGLIAVNAAGDIVMAFNSAGMKRACVGSRAAAQVGSTTLRTIA